eukprot:6193469-Pleurochrysis_carterae.AAC.2
MVWGRAPIPLSGKQRERVHAASPRPPALSRSRMHIQEGTACDLDFGKKCAYAPLRQSMNEQSRDRTRTHRGRSGRPAAR